MAQVVELVEVDGVQAGVESVDDPGADGALAPIRLMDNTEVRQLRPILLQDGRCFVRGAIVYDDPQRGQDGLSAHAVESPPHVVGLVATGRDQKVAARAANSLHSRGELPRSCSYHRATCGKGLVP